MFCLDGYVTYCQDERGEVIVNFWRVNWSVGPFSKQDGACYHLHHTVRVAVGSRTPILEISVAVNHHLVRDADGRVVIGSAAGEVVNVARLTASRQSSLVVLATFRVVRADVARMLLTQLLNRLLDLADNVQ